MLAIDAPSIRTFFESVGSHAAIAAFTSILGAAAGLIAGHYLGLYVARQKYGRGDFLNRLNVSLNIFEDGSLKVSTIMERPLSDVVHSLHVQNKLLTGAKQKLKHKEQSAVFLPGEEGLTDKDMAFALACVVNATAEHFSHGPLRKDLGRPVELASYAICLSCEPVAERRYQKIRAILVRDNILKNFPYPNATKTDQKTLPQLERPEHADRVVTLCDMAKLYSSHPQAFATMEIGV